MAVDQLTPPVYKGIRTPVQAQVRRWRMCSLAFCWMLRTHGNKQTEGNSCMCASESYTLWHTKALGSMCRCQRYHGLEDSHTICQSMSQVASPGADSAAGSIVSFGSHCNADVADLVDSLIDAVPTTPRRDAAHLTPAGTTHLLALYFER